MLTSAYWQSARPRAGSRPFRAASGELSSRSRGRRFRSGRQRLVLGNNSRRRAAPTSGRFVPAGSSPPCAHGLRMIIATAGGQPADLPAGDHPPHRSSRPLAGPLQPSLGPLRLDSSPQPMDLWAARPCRAFNLRGCHRRTPGPPSLQDHLVTELTMIVRWCMSVMGSRARSGCVVPGARSAAGRSGTVDLARGNSGLTRADRRRQSRRCGGRRSTGAPCRDDHPSARPGRSWLRPAG
jgi:hypothetical protein